MNWYEKQACVRNAISIMAVGTCIGSNLILNGCSESGSNEVVPVPRVTFECLTSACRNYQNPRVFLVFTTSGCEGDAVNFGITLSGSSDSVSCSPTAGCVGEISSWVNSKGTSTTLPSGTYSICGRIDYDRKYPSETTGDSVSILNGIIVDRTRSGTGVVHSLTSWSDP